MTFFSPSPGNDPGLPAPVLGALRDHLLLALDEVETGPMDGQAVARVIGYTRAALALAKRGAM
jgi:hypothetical protein